MKRKPLEKLFMALAATFVFVSPAMNSIAMAEGTNDSSGQTTVNADNDEQKITSQQQQQQEEQPAASDQQPKGTQDSGSGTGDSGKVAPTTGQSPTTPSTGQDSKGNPEQPRAPDQKDDENKGTYGHEQQQKVPVKVYKYASGTTKGLQGAHFKLYQNGKSDGKTYQTDASGTVSLGSLAPGNYTLAEIQAPTGYEITNQYTSFTVVKGATYKNVIVYNKAKETPKGSLTVTKYNENQSKRLAGATFAVYDGKQLVKSDTTNGYGTVTFTGLDIGKTYTVYETAAPKGYVKETAPKTATITAKGGAVSFTNKLAVVEQKYGKIKIFKKDQHTSKPLAGATFAVKSGDEVKNSAQTDAYGFVTVSGLTVGKTYSVYEIAAPEGYVKSDEVKSVTVKDGSSVTFYNKKVVAPAEKGKLVVYKYKEGTKTPLAGATFALTLDGQQVATKTTGTDGVIAFDGLDVGKKYTVTETVAPEGYEKTTATQTATVTKDGASLVFYNKAKGETPSGKGKVVVYKYKEGTKIPLAGATFALTLDGQQVATKTTGTDGVITFDGLQEGKQYVVTETVAPEGYEKVSSSQTVKASKYGAYVKFYNKQKAPVPTGKGNITVNKVDESQKPLAGATFTLSVDGVVVDTKTTDGSGVITFSGLDIGKTYVVTETKAPEGYEGTGPQTVSFTATEKGMHGGSKDVTKSLTFVNKKIKSATGELTIVKKDKDTKKVLAGATFAVIDTVSGETVGTATTDASGKVTFKNLAVDRNYVVKEVSAPEGYKAVSGEQTVKIPSKSGHKICYYELLFFNEKIKEDKGSVGLLKVDAKDKKKKLAGASFVLLDQDMKQVRDAKVTDGNGYVSFDGLAAGTYYFKEVAAPSGYVLSETPIKVVVDAKGKAATVYAKNTAVEKGLGTVKLYKYVGDKKSKPLAGATFQLYDANYQPVSDATYTTSADGYITVSNLTVGATYFFKETAAPEGYELNTSYHKVVAAKHAMTGGVAYVSNKEAPAPKGNVTLTKVDADDEQTVLKGAVFGLYKDGVLVQTMTTNDSGQISATDLEYGSYYLQETVAPAGYELSNAKYEFVISHKMKDPNVSFTAKNTKTVEKLGSAKLKKVDEKGKPLAGATFTLFNSNNDAVGQATSGEDGYVVVNDLKAGDYYFMETAAPAGYEFDATAKYPVKVVGDAKDAKTAGHHGGNVQKVVNKKVVDEKGSVTLTKTDGKNNLAGAVFQLYKADGTKVGEPLTTGDNGVVSVTDLAYGSYYFQEVTAPEGYVIDETPIKFEISKDKLHVNQLFMNKKTPEGPSGKGVAKIKKVDEKGKPLAGATFTLYNAKGEVVGTAVSENSGFVTIRDLAYGDYYFMETAAPEGYEFDKDAKYNVKVSKNGHSKFIYVTNKKAAEQKGSATLMKTDGKNGLAGAVFQLYKADGTKVGEPLTTDDKGVISVTDLAYGSYYFQEVTAPEGYVLDQTPVKFDISKKQTDVKQTFKNKKAPAHKGVAKIKKVDEKGKPLAGATFTLYDADGKAVGTAVSAENGYVTVSDLAYGSYYFMETAAPAGYEFDKDAKYNVKVDKYGHGKVIYVTNKKAAEKKGSIALTKFGEGKRLAGAVFQLYKADHTPVGEPVTTGNNGQFAINNLAYGDYYLKELAAPAGYELDETPIPFTISDDTRNVSKVFKNEKQKTYYGSVKVKKVDQDGKPLAGAVFNIYNFEDDYVGTVTSGEDGYASMGNLPAGPYYFKEVSAPAGYEFDANAKYDVVISKDETAEQTVPTVENKLIPAQTGSATIVKMGDGKQLTGAVFQLYKADGTAVGSPITSDANGIVKATDLAFGDYYFKEIAAPAGYKLDDTPIPFTISKTSIGFQKVFNNAKDAEPPVLGSVSLVKVDSATKATLSNVVFDLYKDGTLYGTYTTNASGMINVADLPAGQYYFKEKAPLTGYYPNTMSYAFTIDKAHVTHTVTVQNTKIPPVVSKGHLQLTKIEAGTSTPLAGAIFNLVDDKGNIVRSGLVTDANGQILVENLELGSYSFIETKAPAGYVLDTTPVTGKVEANKVTPVSKVNKADQGSVILTKVDSVTNAALSGAVFKVVDGAGNTVKDNLTTNASGQIVVNDLATGSYSFVETKAPDGYKLDSTPQPFTITKDQTAAAQVTMKNTLNPGSVVLTKVDDKSGKALSGAVFKLVDSAGNTLANDLTTNASGQISMNELAPGTYSLIETTAPAGYVLDETPVSFTIEKNQQTALQLTKDNTLKPGTVILQKLDGRTGDALAGVTFDLQDEDGNTVKANLKTGNDGRITLSDLAPGKYQFIERATLEGYELSDTPIVFTIEENQQNPVMVAMLNFPSSDAPPEPEDPDPEDPTTPTTPTKPTTPGTSTGTNPPSNTNTGSNTNTNNVTNNNTVTSNVPGTTGTKPTVTSSSTYTNPANASSGTNTANKAGLPQTGTAYAMTFGLGVVLLLFAWWMIRRSRRA